MTATAQALIVATARTYLGTPWVHAQSTRGVGVDCVGLFVGVLRDLQIADYQPPNYGRQTSETELRREIELFCAPAEGGRQNGDLLLFDCAGVVQHCGMVTEGGGNVLHAVMGAGKVVEHRLDEGWKRRIRGHYRLKDELWEGRPKVFGEFKIGDRLIWARDLVEGRP